LALYTLSTLRVTPSLKGGDRYEESQRTFPAPVQDFWSRALTGSHQSAENRKRFSRCKGTWTRHVDVVEPSLYIAGYFPTSSPLTTVFTMSIF
jgi:hypothetical protein